MSTAQGVAGILLGELAAALAIYFEVTSPIAIIVTILFVAILYALARAALALVGDDE